MAKEVTRLLDQFAPEHYDLALEINKSRKTFSGQVIIKGKKTGRPAKRLTFHQKDLNIISAKITKHDKKGDLQIEVARLNKQKTFDELRLHANEMIFPGSYTIEINFAGKITDNMNGVYPCYFDNKGKKDFLIATQFESHHAREVFPCIDEPAAKATFDLTITGPDKEEYLANTNPKKTSTSKQQKTVQFETTPKMSTYLLAFVVGDIKHKTAKTKDGVIINAHAIPEKVNEVDFALDTAVKTLEFYNDYFGIPYPLDKCDLIALPDFASGAMENWGLITFREQCMLVDPKNTSIHVKQYVAMVVTHEFAHQWFGNLVTMRWWTDLWLNEGFASWIEYMAVDHIFPDWQMWTQFVSDEQQAAMRLDALANTHPVEVAVHHPDEIRTIFDTISYAKGSSMIHMLHDYLGADDFQKGLQLYLKKHAYSNTDTSDLWQALEEASGKPVKSFMGAWTSTPGYPIVQASIATDNPQLIQNKFLVNGKQDDDTIWPVPLLSNEPLGQDSFSEPKMKLKVEKLTDRFQLNHERAGFYRTVYDSKHTLALAQAVQAGELEPLARLGLLSDYFEASKAGYTSTVDALNLLAAYAEEDNSAVWDVIAGNVGEIRSVLGSDEELREAMKPFIIKLTDKERVRLGWQAKKNEPYFDGLLRPTILGLSSAADEPSVVSECQKRFKAMKKPEDIDPDLRGVIWNTVARHGNQKEFDQFVDLHNHTNNSELKVTLASVITGFKDPKLVGKALAFVKTDMVRNQDAAYWIAYALANRWGRDTAWQWVQDNWAWLEKNLGSDLSFYRFPIYVGRVMHSKKQLEEYNGFFESKSSPALERSIKQGREMIEWHTAWYKRDHDKILEFFK